jgi:AraC-like DNA-binding protein
MRSTAADWVPDGAWLAPGYAEWAPPRPLRGMVACLWASVVPEDRDGDPDRDRDGHRDAGALILPDGCSDLIWEQGRGAYIAGPDTGPVRAAAPPGTVMAGVRFRPPAGGPALGLPLSELRDLRAGLADVLPAASAALVPGLHPAIAATRILGVAGTLVAGAAPDLAVAHAARLLRDPVARLERVAADVDLSERHLRRRFHDAVGYGPKTLQRVYRFQRFVRRVDASRGACDLAVAAIEAGYADQAHLTRDCLALSGLTPAVLARARVPATRP